MATVFPLSEGSFTVGHDKEFVPFKDGVDELTNRSTGSLHVEVQPFMVVTQQDIIIFDTGLGFKNEQGVLQIHQNIIDAGYAIENVTKVCQSHLHKDHAGCLVYTDHHGVTKPTFPNATYYIYRPELDFALKTGYPSYYLKDIEPLIASQQISWLDGEEGIIDEYIHYYHSGGHCPEHIVFLVDDGINKVFYGGDEAPQLKQLKFRYVAKYDHDGKKALALREQYAALGKDEGWLFLFYHDVKMAMATL